MASQHATSSLRYVRWGHAAATCPVRAPAGRIGHAELDFNGATLMLSDEYPECQIRGPKSIGGSAVTLHLHVDDADDTVHRAVAAGGTLEMPLADHFYGERSGAVRDPFGHRWSIGHSIEAVEPDEMQRRYDALMAEPAAKA